MNGEMSGAMPSTTVLHDTPQALPGATQPVISGTVRDVESHVYLTAKEAALLQILTDEPGRPIDRDELVRRLYGDGADHLYTLEVHIHNLRKKLRPFPSIRIATVRDPLGYLVYLRDREVLAG